MRLYFVQFHSSVKCQSISNHGKRRNVLHFSPSRRHESHFNFQCGEFQQRVDREMSVYFVSPVRLAVCAQAIICSATYWLVSSFSFLALCRCCWLLAYFCKTTTFALLGKNCAAPSIAPVSIKPKQFDRNMYGRRINENFRCITNKTPKIRLHLVRKIGKDCASGVYSGGSKYSSPSTPQTDHFK